MNWISVNDERNANKRVCLLYSIQKSPTMAYNDCWSYTSRLVLDHILSHERNSLVFVYQTDFIGLVCIFLDLYEMYKYEVT